MLSVCLPGTGGFMPLPDRWLTCCWMEYQGKGLLIDCGEGTQIALRAAGCRFSRMELLLLTHYHADHVAGLPGLLLSLGNMGRQEPLTIAGPPGLRLVVQALLVIAPIPYPLRLVELSPGASLPGWEGLSIDSLPLKHRVPCYGYRVTVRRKPVFDPEKAERLGVPKSSWRVLHAGGAVELEDGRRIQPPEVLAGARTPIRVTYCTDTLPIPEIAQFAQGADLMIGEGMYGDEALAERLGEKMHSLFSQTARLAAEAGAKRLWLTHYSPALAEPKDWAGTAEAYFPGAVTAHDGIKLTLGGEAAGPWSGEEWTRGVR